MGKTKSKKIGKSSLLNSKNNKSIIKQGKSPKSLKPLRARQVIRRFHTLIKYKSQLINKLGFKEETYLKEIKQAGLENQYNNSFKNIIEILEVNKTPNCDERFKFGNEIEIVMSLGSIDGEIEKRGGIETYQRASKLGQDGKRGGDSSKQLIEWFKELNIKNLNKALEIGSLSCKNFISTSGIFKDIIRIDLNSVDSMILKQDFLKMEVPVPIEKFNLISCSLVINFVPNAEDRGLMIKLFSKFLKSKGDFLFIVLPLPCIENSRYICKENLYKIFKTQGFKPIKEKDTHKLHYVLFEWDGGEIKNGDKFHFKKEQIRTGSNRNNFSIIL